MKKFFPLLLALLVSCGAAPAPKDSVVNVRYFNSDTDETRTCTGIVVGIVRVLTAEHCVSDKFDVYVNDHIARIMKVDEDLALLSVLEPLTDVSVIKVAGDSPVAGDPVVTYGFAYSGPLLRLNRTVAGYVEGWMILDGPMAAGMSGGPVVNSKGELVGVNQAANETVGMTCNTKEIRDFLK